MQHSADVVLSLGSNFDDRRANLHAGLERLRKLGHNIHTISPVVESPAQLPPNSPAEWNRPFLNLIAIGTTSRDFKTFLGETKAVQTAIGKSGDSKWSPRELDIDIVTWTKHSARPEALSARVPEIFTRPYVLSPLLHAAPDWPVSESAELSALELSSTAQIEFHIPLWMGILNITPDSFSDGGRYRSLDDVETEVKHMIECGVNIIDVGAESTRPNANPLSDGEEWSRLEPVLAMVRNLCADTTFAPQISIDTYHPVNAEKALEFGVDMINDVSGLRDEAMLALARDSGKTFVAMHSVTVPVDPQISIGRTDDACEIFAAWIDQGRKLWDSRGLDPSKIIVDPGIGFGKSSLQSLDLMRSVKRFRKLGHRVLIGHSRKRFLRTFAKFDSPDLDTETIGASLNLCAQSVDILRVHNVGAHVRAYLSWAHLLGNRDGDNA